MTSWTGHQTIAIYILPNISRSTGNQIIKLGQLSEYNMKNIFLEKSHTKYGGEASKSKLSICRDQQAKMS